MNKTDGGKGHNINLHVSENYRKNYDKIFSKIINHAHKFNNITGECEICNMTREEIFIQASGEHPDI